MKLLNSMDVAAALGCNADTARRLMRQMPHIDLSIGNRSMLRVDEADLQAYINSRKAYPMKVQRGAAGHRIPRR